MSRPKQLFDKGKEFRQLLSLPYTLPYILSKSMLLPVDIAQNKAFMVRVCEMESVRLFVIQSCY